MTADPFHMLSVVLARMLSADLKDKILVGSARSHGSLRSQRSHRSIMGLSAQQVFWVSLQGSLFLVLRGETSL